jgi:hypothetical protein
MPLRHFIPLMVLFLSVTALRNCDAQTAEKKPLGNQDIIDLLKAGLTPDVVVAKIKASICDFDTSPVSLKDLKSAAVPDAVILAMVQAPVMNNHVSAIHRATYDSVHPVVPHKQISDVSSPQPNTVTAIAYRVIPQQNTTYYQTGGNSSSASCYGNGQFSFFGNYGNLNMNTNCNTTYTTPTQVPITWKFADVYVVVENATQIYLIGCRANWRWSNCAPLIVGDVFPVEISGGTMKIPALKNGKKAVKTKYNILQVAQK